MASPRRVEQISILIREVIARILVEDFVPPAGAMVTVTRVVPSEDLQYAGIYISVLGGGETVEGAALTTLKRETGAIQHRLNRALRMRPVPKIHFAIDETEKRRERVEQILGKSDGKIDSAPIL